MISELRVLRGCAGVEMHCLEQKPEVRKEREEL
jgi:hypothetical protein